GKFKLEVINEDSFELSIENGEFRIFNPNDPYYKTLPEQEISLKKSVYSFGQVIKGDNFSFTVNQIASLPGDIILFNLVDTPSLALKYRGELGVSPINKQASILSLSLETPV